MLENENGKAVCSLLSARMGERERERENKRIMKKVESE